MAVHAPDDVVRVRAHGLEWRVAAEFADALPSLAVGTLRDPKEPGEFQIVKDNRVRTVARAAWPGRQGGPGLYVKRFKLPGTGLRLKHLVIPTQAEQEWRVSRALVALGIPTSRALAVAVRRSGALPAEAFLVSEEIVGAEPLSGWLAAHAWPSVDARLRRELTDELADLTARMLCEGVCHNDLHAGNVLIIPDAPAGRRFCVVDLHRVRLGGVGERGAARMMSFLADSTARLGVGGRDRLRFLHRVLGWGIGRHDARYWPLRTWADRVRVQWEKHRRRYTHRRTYRCLRKGPLFTRERAGGFRIFRRRGIASADLLALVDMHRRAVAGEANACQVRKAATRTQISVCPGPGGRRFLVKAFLRNSAYDRLKDLVRPCGRARDAWIAHRGFCVRGVPTPEAVALLETTSKLSGRPDYVIMEALDVVGDLRQIVFGMMPDGSQRDGPALGPQERRELPPAIADLFCLLAERQVRHRDMKPSNILITRDASGLRLWLVDLERAQFDWRWRREHWIHHLAQCNAGLPANVTILERMRCLRRCGQGRWTPQERLHIAREILAASLRRGAKWLT